MSPAMPIAIPLIAPSTSPISRAFVVPRACDAVPIAVPAATELFILKILMSIGENTAPKIPVNTNAITVTDGIPP